MRIGIRLVLASLALLLGGTLEGKLKANFISDPGFEQSANGHFSSYWTPSNPNNVLPDRSNPYSGGWDATFSPTSSLQTLSQTLSIGPGTYTLSFYAEYSGTGKATGDFKAILDGVTAVDIAPDPTSPNNNHYVYYTATVTTTDTNPVLQFETTAGSNYQFNLDDTSLTPYVASPEPGSIVLLGLGGLTLTVFACLRRKNATLVTAC